MRDRDGDDEEEQPEITEQKMEIIAQVQPRARFAFRPP